ncbi:MAG: helix-turn-helix domain-containing protein [Candidatus Gracilibacteria bacterium]|jgi:sugar-specific transcriptional regulator TrmB
MEISPFVAEILGLNKKDLSVYLDLLKFGSSAVSTIAVRTNIERTTTHAVIKRLVRKGFISRTSKDNTNLFAALDPEVFEEKIKRDFEQKRADLSVIQSFIPQLQNIKCQSANRPVIQVFEGPEGVISLYELLLRTNKKQDAFLTIEKIPKTLKKYLTEDYIKHKISNNVQSRVLVEDSPRAKKYQHLDRKANRITKLLPKGQFPFETEIIVGDNGEIAIIDFSKIIIGVLIKSSSVRNTISAIFELLWKIQCDPYPIWWTL